MEVVPTFYITEIEWLDINEKESLLGHYMVAYECIVNIIQHTVQIWYSMNIC